MALMSCNNDRPCRNDDECGTYGTCLELSADNICRCQSGYETDSMDLCEVRSFDKFEGNWAATETRVNNETFTSEELSYNVTIYGDTSTLTRVFLRGLGDFDNTPCDFTDPLEVIATISTSTIRLVSATYCPVPQEGRAGYVVSAAVGTNTIDLSTQNEINMTYNLQLDVPDGLNPGAFTQQSFTCDVKLVRS